MCLCNQFVKTPFCGKPGCTLEDARLAAAAAVTTEIGKKPVVHSWFGAFELECPCGAFSMQNLRKGQVILCRKCPRAFRIDDFGIGADGQSLRVELSMGFRDTTDAPTT